MGKEILSQCRMTVSEGIKSKGWTLLEDLIKTGFKITSSSPLIIEKGATSREELIKLVDLLTSGDEIQECSGKSASAKNINKGNNVQEKEGIRNISEESAFHDQVKITEPEVEDYVMKKHSFQLAGEYFKDRDWKELFNKAEEINEGFCFRGKGVSADEYRMLQNLKKIIFETIDIPEDEAHKVKEAAEYINCVDHGVCVIDYNSRPYLVGPKAQVHAAKEEILYTLKEDGVDCHLTSPKALPKHDILKEKEKNTNTSNVIDKANAEKDKEFASSPETESDAESDKTEYIMEKGDFKLAKQYFEGRPEHQYFDMAVRRGGGYSFNFSSAAADCSLFMKTLRRLNFETVSHRENDKAKVRSIADQLKCGDLDVKVIEKGPKSLLVGPKDKVARIKQKIISELYMHYNTVEGGDSLEDDDDTPKSSKGGARPKKFNMPRSLQDKRTGDFRFDSEDTSRSPHQVETYSGTFGRDVDPGVYTGHYSDIKVKLHKADITRLDVDCIVNAANTRLKHAGGVARVIATAAGREMQEACENFTSAGNSVPVTGLFVSPGGHLPAKYVLHAVGPKWDMYTDKKKCTDDLRRTVLRCLVEAMRLGMSSIALPSISAAIFKVPKEHCARSYMNAVKHFEEIVRKDMDHRDCTLKDIHFVDVDDSMVNCIRECFMKHWREPSDPDARQADENVYQEQLKSSKSQLPGNQISGPSQRSLRPSSPEDKPIRPRDVPSSSVAGATTKNVKKDTVYQLGDLQLCVSSRPALSIRSDLVITVGEEFDKLSGIPDYNVKSNKKPNEYVPKKKNCFTFSWIHKPDGKHRQLLCRLFPDPKSQSELGSAFEHLDTAIRLAAVRDDKVKDVKSFVLTSSVLYADPSNKKHKPPIVIDRKLVGNFGKQVFDYVEKLSKESNCKVKQVVVTASEDVSIQLCKIMETRPGIKNVDASAPGAYPHPKPSGQSPARWGAGSRGGSTSSLNSGGAAYGQPSSVYYNSGPRGQSPAMSGSDYQGSSSNTLSSSSGQTKYDRQHSSGDSKREPTSLGGMASLGATDHGSSSGSPVDQWLVCGICTLAKRTVKNTSCCGILLCKDCCDRVSFCPYCTKQWKIRTGNQPRGYMEVRLIGESADGYESKESWKIDYSFPSGTQTDDHPNPGKWYNGTKRTAYIPATKNSIDLLKLLRLAFIRRLTFTIGVSHTTGQDNKITWNDINHKTNLHGGNFGFPDPTYFTRVIAELRAKGVTLDSMTETEISLIKTFEQSLTSSFPWFSDYTSVKSCFM